MKIPFLGVPDKVIISTTQGLVPIADFVDGIVIYKNGGAAQIMESTSLNFGLLSEIEQKAVMASYAGLLNSFNFPVQIVVRSQKKDISSYMDYLNTAEKKISNPLLLSTMKSYKDFIFEAIKKKNVLSKKFYIVIPFTPFELGITKTAASVFRFPKKNEPLPYPKSYVIRKAKVALFPKRQHLMRQAGRLNITLKPLTNKGLTRLFYNVFNPETPIKELEGFG